MSKVYFAAKDPAIAFRAEMLDNNVVTANPLHALEADMQDSEGATAIEYSLIATGIAMAIIVAVMAVIAPAVA